MKFPRILSQELARHFFCFSLIFSCFFAGGLSAHHDSILPKQETPCSNCHVNTIHAPTFKQDLSDDFRFAYLWDPKLLNDIPSFSSRARNFKLVQAKISGKAYQTPSGNVIYGLTPTPELKKLFSYNSNHLIYIFLSAETWENPPVHFPNLQYGLKAFTSSAAWPGKKANGLPVVWIPRELKGAVQPGNSLVLIVPTVKLENSLWQFEKTDSQEQLNWFFASIPEFAPFFDRKLAQRSYAAHCASCHGERGDGHGPAAVFLYPKPRDFTSGEFKFKTSTTPQMPTDEDFFRTITSGLFGTSMPGFSFLPSRERWMLAQYIKFLAVDRNTGKKIFDEHPSRDIVAVQEPRLQGKSLARAAARGEKLFYGLARCSDCHGPGAKSSDHLPRGDGPSAPSQMDDWGYPIKPADLACGTLKRGNDPSDVYLDISTGIMGTLMPAYKGTLTEKQRWDLAFYVSNLNREHPVCLMRQLHK